MSVLAPEAFYKAANLTSNPFRTTPIYGPDPRMNIWVGYDREREQMMKLVTRARSDQVGSITCLFIYGPYGGGKSHALLWTKNQIEEEMRDEFESLCFFIPTLKKDKGKMTFAGALAEDIIEAGQLAKNIYGFKRWLASRIPEYKMENAHGEGVTEDYIIGEMINSPGLFKLAKEIFKCEDENAVTRNILNTRSMGDHSAMTLFTRLANLFTFPIKIGGSDKRFKKAIYLMIDELDDLLRTNVKEAREVNDLLRHIYDACPNCFGLILAASAELATFAAMFEQYMIDRIQRRISFEPMDKSDAIEFIGAILKANRINNQRNYLLFEKTAVEDIVSQFNEVTPRLVVNKMQEILEEVRLAGFDPAKGTVDSDFLDEHSVVEEVFGSGNF